jgi:DNA-binding PadR family transcriptional regulator
LSTSATSTTGLLRAPAAGEGAPVHVREIDYRDPVALFAVFADDRYAALLDSALLSPQRGRYAFIAPEPFRVLTSKDGAIALDGERGTGNPFDVLRRELARHALQPAAGLPPFQGGAVGYFGYELAQHLERVPLARSDDRRFPDLVLGFHDAVVAFDHRERRAWIVSSGLPEADPAKRRERAMERLDAISARLATASLLPRPGAPPVSPAIVSNFTRGDYEAAVRRVVDYILTGDIFQANLSQRFTAPLPAGMTPFDLYRRLRGLNPAPFAAFLKLDDLVVASASPERFVQLRDGLVESDDADDGTQKGFHITDAGREELDDWLHTPPDTSSPPRDELVIKVLVALRIPGVDAAALAQLYRRHVIEAMQQYTRVKETAAEDDLGLLLVADAEIYRLEAVIRWLDAADARIARLPAPAERILTLVRRPARRRVGARR